MDGPQRPDETWHRLREWTGSQASSEQLAAHVLLDAGYADVDPTHPHGGPDGGKDATASKDGKRWIMAVYFPIGQVPFTEFKRRFKADFAGLRANGVDGMVFVTNQALTQGDRRPLDDSVEGPPTSSTSTAWSFTSTGAAWPGPLTCILEDAGMSAAMSSVLVPRRHSSPLRALV